MDPPSDGWHIAIFDPRFIDDLDDAFTACQDELLGFFEIRYGEGMSEFETPESIAIDIGSHALSAHTEHIQPVLDDNLDNHDTTAEKLCKGYIGVRTIEEAS